MFGSWMGYTGGLLRGIVRYAREHGPWEWYGLNNLGQPVTGLDRWDGDGVFVGWSRMQIEQVLQRRIPAVSVSDSAPESVVPRVVPDNIAAGAILAEHLLERGLRQFAMWGEEQVGYSDRRIKGFCQRLAERGFRPAVLRLSRPGDSDWSAYREEATRWLLSLPRPVGLAAVTDKTAWTAAEICRAVGLAVPDDIAIVGIDNDVQLCELSTPPLSSLDLDLERVGFEAAAVLDRLMAGERDVPLRTELPPGAVVVRQSTDVLAIEDECVAAAVRTMRRRYLEPLTMDDLVDEAHVSRRALELRFRKVMGCSPMDQLRRVRLARAQELLVTTKLPIPVVAEQSGFGDVRRLLAACRAAWGTTPLRYRLQHSPDAC
jgi:LacI family transcriptional regulator